MLFSLTNINSFYYNHPVASSKTTNSTLTQDGGQKKSKSTDSVQNGEYIDEHIFGFYMVISGNCIIFGEEDN